MLKLVITTQYKENYAAHDENYVHGVSESYWKFKGGSTYVIEDLDFINTEYLQGLVDEVSPIFVFDGEASQEYILNWEMVSHEETPWDEWETPYKLQKFKDAWFMTKFDDNTDMGYMRHEILSKMSEWCYQDGELVKGSYNAEFKMNDGTSVLGQEGLKNWYASKEAA
jgi:hypothetical protein